MGCGSILGSERHSCIFDYSSAKIVGDIVFTAVDLAPSISSFPVD
ncbi:MAG: hypothetical protein ACTTKL_02850 [Treponema sp.]